MTRPVDNAHASARSKEPQRPDDSASASPVRLTLAVVDDDDEVRKALGRLLRSLGHEVRAYTSAEAYEADPAAADCLILDIRLPGLNGLELRERIRLRGSSMPIVFITGDGGPYSPDRADHSGPLFLAKPFDDNELIAVIARAMAAAPDGR